MTETTITDYTKSNAIDNYMLRKLGIEADNLILEPCVGDGRMLKALLTVEEPCHIDALVSDEEQKKSLEETYPQVDTRIADALTDKTLDLYSDLPNEHYDRIICNPPYGAKLTTDRRKELKKRYKGHYVKESYALYLLRSLSVLKEGGKLSVIIPDTYLFTNRFVQLRKVLLTQSRIDEILIFPPKMFMEANFGYSNLSIITLTKSLIRNPIGNSFKVMKGFESLEDFEALNRNEMPEHLTAYEFRQDELLANENCKLLLGEDSTVSMLSDSETTLGDVADVVTGLCTGNNRRFLRVLNHDVKGSKGFDTITPSKIYNCTSIDGIPFVGEGYVPYAKGSPTTRYLANNGWYIRWDRDTVNTYKTWKNTRFQNADYYFKFGIGIPMTKSKKMRACLLNGDVFDQSIVGVFPHDESKILYILALMNSDIFNELIHIANPTTNNSANYIKEIPYREPSRELFDEIVENTKKAIHVVESGDLNKMESIHARINARFNEIYEISAKPLAL